MMIAWSIAWQDESVRHSETNNFSVLAWKIDVNSPCRYSMYFYVFATSTEGFYRQFYSTVNIGGYRYQVPTRREDPPQEQLCIFEGNY